MTRYHPLLVALHWLLAAMIILGLILGGTVLAETANDDPFKLTALRMHMSMGMIILALMLLRLATRLTTRKPPHSDIGNALLNWLGQAMHWALYCVVIALCLSGLATATMAGLPGIVFGGSGAPLPADFAAFPPRAAHGALAFLLGVLILGHAGAGLWHHYVRRDGLFRRMWFGQREE
ncbi:cytochrome b/b6 domain-containing protein [Tropicimonas sp. TH_r6]|uniref:cytochrome b n=1 Tax=Tropicimonas sp. TH_r6 TaxID=3082085 RepID=UPI002953A5BD|nr:cytochrome b/b6 domain-containing protein [Tropicimonas sp. TH_r6]MDV7142673.1 cytochrome b/b6 domain-containing protein [Tropicimonas sp. TH_r6]